nr:hypothetical protein [Tanacetum cinerariifolium]
AFYSCNHARSWATGEPRSLYSVVFLAISCNSCHNIPGGLRRTRSSLGLVELALFHFLPYFVRRTWVARSGLFMISHGEYFRRMQLCSGPTDGANLLVQKMLWTGDEPEACSKDWETKERVCPHAQIVKTGTPTQDSCMESQTPNSSNDSTKKILKTVDKMMRVTTSVAALSHEQKKSFLPWKPLEGNQKQNFKKGGFQNQQRPERKQDRFTILTKTHKEIFALEKGKFKALPPMTTRVEKR